MIGLASATSLYQEKAKTLYNKHGKPHVDSVVTHPQYEKHVAPALSAISSGLATARAAAVDARADVFDLTVTQFKEICPRTIAALEDLSLPSAVLSRTRQSCDEPEVAVARFYVALAVTFLALFYRSIWGLFRRVISPILPMRKPKSNITKANYYKR